ncbi:MAG: metal ABC transporter permease [Planctomycetaceae bacterium]|jgi:zinc transport system permease protein|nr:metal ABC transporter permease [Planctomycetaceae bacterium]
MFDTLFCPFMLKAFLISATAAVPFGLIGTFVVVRRIGYLAGAIAHCALGGVGAGLYLQFILSGTVFAALFPPSAVSAAVTILSALLIGAIHFQAKEREDTIIGAVWVITMAAGFILLDITPGSGNISAYLFGDVLLITNTDMILVAGLSTVILAAVIIFFQRFEAVCFDPEFAKVRGISTAFYFLLLLVLTAMTVVTLVQVVGIVLVIAMLTLPAATACRLAKRLLPICGIAVLIGFLSSWIGLVMSVWLYLPAGSSIVLVAATFYLLSLLKRN